ncbi:MAG: response regulator transcription factor [Abditibacteriales bacterium]|nr:response regulator transcription factor [Abditibacteriales bacterium]MDW8367933.1 response regulator transcription factor [Abditibacteriales bacterium]
MAEGKVLVIEDDEGTCELLRAALTEADYEVLLAHDGEEGLAALRRESPDLVLLDWILPKMSGEEVCRRAREFTRVPILMLTARSAEADRIAGLNIGADDYIVKPFLPGELIARVRAHLRRMKTWSAPAANGRPKVALGDLVIDPATHTVLRGGREIYLTALEFDLLYCLAAHAGEVLSRERLMDLVWGDRFLEPEGINVHIHRLRKKIEQNPTHPRRLLTVHGVGYKLVP